MELNGLRRYFATNNPVPDTLDVIASQILRVLAAAGTVDKQVMGGNFTMWSQHSHVAKEILYYRFVLFCDHRVACCKVKNVFASLFKKKLCQAQFFQRCILEPGLMMISSLF